MRDQDHAGQERGYSGDGHHGPGWEPGGEVSGGGDGLHGHHAGPGEAECVAPDVLGHGLEEMFLLAQAG